MGRALKVAHVAGWYFPDSSGGTEVYIDALARHLARDGIESIVAAARDWGPSDGYQWNGIPVKRYRVDGPAEGEIAGSRPHGGFDEFAAWLGAQDADVYHQHSWTRGCGIAHLRLAKQLGLRTMLTVHVPGVVCLRGTMMLDGVQPCDGHIEVERCTRCWAAARGIPVAVANWQARHPAASERLGGRLPSRLRTAFLTPALVARRQEEVAEMCDLADRVVAVARWLYDALARNGVPPHKLVYCAQGIEALGPPRLSRPAPRDGRALRVGFLGRWDPVKGIHVLTEAFRRIPTSIPVELLIHALPGDREYERTVRASASGDARIQILEPVGRDQVSSVMASFDVLAVPSLWLETGPLVALEALASGTPVIGSDLGGIAEIVTAENGALVPAGHVEAWTQALLRAAASNEQRPLPPVPRSSREVAAEMASLYRQIAGPERIAPAPVGSLMSQVH